MQVRGPGLLHPSLNGRQALPHLTPAFRATLAAGERTLGSTQLFLAPRSWADVLDMATIAQRCEMLDAHINADGALRCRLSLGEGVTSCS